MIKRGKRPTRFTVLPNAILEDARIDWRDLGLLAYLLSKPDDWHVMPQQLANCRKAGKDAIYASLKRLRDAGYVSRTPNPNGGWDWIVYEGVSDKPHTDNPDSATPNRDNPNTEIPNTEKPTLLNTETTPNTDGVPNTNTDGSPLPSCEFAEKPNGSSDESFSYFWSIYPVRRDKKKAREIWKRRKLDTIADTICNDVRVRQQKDAQWKAGYVPHPTTYLRNDRWEDEYGSVKKDGADKFLEG